MPLARDLADAYATLAASPTPSAPPPAPPTPPRLSTIADALEQQLRALDVQQGRPDLTAPQKTAAVAAFVHVAAAVRGLRLVLPGAA